MTAYDKLLEHINGLWILDTHEHLPAEADRQDELDVLGEWLKQYFCRDLVSAGLPKAELEFVRDGSKDLMKRWKLVEPYWQAARLTGYGRGLDLAARGLYDVEGVSRRTIQPLNEAFLAARRKGGHYQYVLKDKSRIRLSIIDSRLDCDRRFFASAVRMAGFIIPAHRQDIERVGSAYGVRVHSLDDWVEAMRLAVDDKVSKRGAVTIKCGLAYLRTLHFAKAPAAQAQREFNELFANEHSPEARLGIKIGKAFQDYMMHRLLSLADQRGLTVQFHTGIQEGHGNVVSDSNPVLLTNLLLEYGNVKFDVFHMGYPYMLELSNMAKNFPNCFIDMCWGHIISPHAARWALAEWLDAVPANKISAFGGDHSFVDAVYGHQRIARDNVAAVLSEKVNEGTFDIDRAKQIAEWLFVDNPTRLFNLSGRIKAAGRKPKSADKRRKPAAGRPVRR